MARIRTIKPELPHSESMGRVSRDARLTFILLWTLADDSGRLRGNSRMLASLLFPYDDDAKDLIEGWLVELEREGCVRRYTIEGTSYLGVCNWLTHQKIDKPTPSKLPNFVELSRMVAKPLEVSSLDLGSGSGSGSGPGSGREGSVSTRARDVPCGTQLTDADNVLGFERVKLSYPKFTGRQDWGTAEHHCNLLVERGDTWDSLVESAERYAAYCAAGGVSSTQYVTTPGKFFNVGAPDKPWKQPWSPPEKLGEPPKRTWRPPPDEPGAKPC